MARNGGKLNSPNLRIGATFRSFPVEASCDKHLDNVALYRSTLRTRFGSIERLDLWGRPYLKFRHGLFFNVTAALLNGSSALNYSSGPGCIPVQYSRGNTPQGV